MKRFSGVLFLAAAFMLAFFMPGFAQSENDTGQAVGTNTDDNSSGVKIISGMPSPFYYGLKKMRGTLRNLIQQRRFAQAEKVVKEIKQYLATNVKKQAINKETYYANIASLHRREIVDLHSFQGQYQKAADSIRQAIRHHQIPTDVQSLMNVQEKVEKQQEFFKYRLTYERMMSGYQRDKQALLKEKIQLLKTINTGRKLSDGQISKLQKALKKIDKKLDSVQGKIKKLNAESSKKASEARQNQVFLSSDQQKELSPMVKTRVKLHITNFRHQMEVTRLLSQIAENSQITWHNLKNDFKELASLQDKLWSLRKRLDALSRKAPLSRKDLKVASDLRNQLENAMKQAAEIMSRIEKAFIDEKVFGKLTAKEKIEFVNLFRKVWNRNKEFESLKPSIDEIYSKIFPIIIGPMPPNPIPGPYPIDPPIATEPLPIEPIEPPPATEPVPLPEPIDPPPAQEDENVIKGNGLLLLEETEWLLKFNGDYYRTMNLPSKFMIHQLEVKFSGRIYYPARPTSADGQEEGESATDSRYRGPKEIYFTSIHAPQLPDEPYEADGGRSNEQPSEVIEDNIDNQDQPANLMNAF
jgi:hypothetical protein